MSDYTNIFWSLRVKKISHISDSVPPSLTESMKFSNINLDSLHFEIGDGMSRVAADVLSTIPPTNIAVIGLDIWHDVIYDNAEREHLKRLVKALQTRGFGQLCKIRVRLEFQFGGIPFEPTVRKFRNIFPEKLLSVENLPYERRYSVRDVIDDCHWSLS